MRRIFRFFIKKGTVRLVLSLPLWDLLQCTPVEIIDRLHFIIALWIISPEFMLTRQVTGIKGTGNKERS